MIGPGVNELLKLLKGRLDMRVNASEDASFCTSFWGNSCIGCSESRGLNSHPDMLGMGSRIKGLFLKP